MTDGSTRPLRLRILLIAVQILLAIVAGFFLMGPLSTAFDALRLGYFNTWAMVHGGFGAAWPAMAIASYALLGYVKWFHRLHDAPLFAAGALLGLVLQGMTRAPEPPDFVMTPLSLSAVACISSALLGYCARRWILLAVVIALPQWIDLVGWLVRIPRFGLDGLEVLAVMIERSLALPVAALAGAALAALTRRRWAAPAAAVPRADRD